MTDASPFRIELFGSDRPSIRRAIAVAGGLFVAAAAVPFVAMIVPSADGESLAYVVVALALATCVVNAYYHTALIESWVLVLTPILGSLLAFQVYPPTGVSDVVALPFSFAGRGATTPWILTGLLLGSIGFLVGVLAQWSIRLLRPGG